MRRALSAATLGALGGLALFAAGEPLALWPLLWAALLPLWLAAASDTATKASSALAGASMGLALAAPSLALLNFPLFAIAGFGLYYMLIWAFSGLALHVSMRGRDLSAASLVQGAALLALIDFGACFVLPVWGTAQSFAKSQTVAPFLAQPAALGGGVALVFAQALCAGLLAALWRAHRERAPLGHPARALGLFAFGYLALCGALWFAARPDTESPSLRVGAIGFDHVRIPFAVQADPERLYASHYKPLLDEARAQGATLILTPEFGIRLEPIARDTFFTLLRDYARTHKVHLGVAYFDRARNTNRVLLINPQGEESRAYEKTHLIATVEDYTPGTGDLLVEDVKGFRVGAMICQDDNYLDLARRYRAEGVDLMLVPTNDWAEVKDLHFANSRLRPIENRYVLLRAALDGHSAIVSARGETLSRFDTQAHDRGVVVATIHKPRLGRALTLDSRLFPALLAALALGLAIRARRRR